MKRFVFFFSVAVAVAVLAATVPAREGAQAADCDFQRSPNAPGTSIGKMPDFNAACETLNNGLSPAVIDITSIAFTHSYTAGGPLLCATWTWAIDTDAEPAEPSGTIYVVPTEPETAPGQCPVMPTSSTMPRKPNGPKIGDGLPDSAAIRTFAESVLKPNATGCDAALAMVFADYRPSASSNAVWPIVVAVSRTGPSDNYCSAPIAYEWDAAAYGFVCPSPTLRRNPNCSGGGATQTGTSGQSQVTVLHANPNGWSSYKIIRKGTSPNTRKLRVRYKFDAGDGTQMTNTWRQFCGGNGQYVNAAKDHWLGHSNSINICTCDDDDDDGKCD